MEDTDESGVLVSESMPILTPAADPSSGSDNSEEESLVAGEKDYPVDPQTLRMYKRKIARSKAALYATALVDSADAVLLPSVFRAFEREFDIGPSMLGRISLCQSLCHSLTSPIWGYYADVYSRRKLLTLGCLLVGVATIFVGTSETISNVIAFRMVTGVGLAAVGPIAQSLVSDLVPPKKRGVAFGMIGLMAGLGSMTGSMFATSVSQQTILGVAGWRFAFYATAMVALILAVVVWFIAFDAPRGGADSAEGDDDHKWILTHKAAERERQTFREWALTIFHFFKLRTFRFMVLSGLFGSIPWSAMHFLTLFLQYVGFTDIQASSTLTFFYLGGMIGNVLGGTIGDRMAVWSPDHGRILTAQMSEMFRIPFVLSLFLLLPHDPSYGVLFAVTLFCQGLVSTWCPAGCNRPILSELVPPEHRSSVFAVLMALEGSIGSLGAPLVGILAENVFGYIKTDDSISTMPAEVRENNLDALSSAAVCVMSIPWGLCIFLYGLIHLSYPSERKLVSAGLHTRQAPKAE